MAAQIGLPNAFYAIDAEAGAFVRYTIMRQQIADVDQQIKALAQETSILFPKFSKLETDVHLCCSPKLLTLTCQLPKLRIATWFRVDPPARRGEHGVATPCFGQQTSFTCVQMDPWWTPPSNMRLFFATHFTPHQSEWLYSQSTLIVICTEKGQTAMFKFPFPNIYENGKLCLGNDATALTDRAVPMPLMEKFSKALTVFQRAPWNGDLLNGRDFAIAVQLVRFDADDPTKQLDPTIPQWWAQLTRINNALVASIPFHTLS